MTIKIKRKTGLLGTLSKFNVKINGEKRGTLENEEILELEIPDGETVLQLTQFGVKTNEINVKDGDRLKVSTTTWGIYGTLMVIFLFIVSGLFIPGVIRYGIVLLYVIAAYLLNGFIYKIIKIPKQAVIRNE